MGRVRCGIVGLPNVGKSTLFSALTQVAAQAANYPFCTIEPNVGVVEVWDPRVDRIAEIFRSRNVVYTHIEFVDIAGLVQGASQGEGLGNRFLSHIREVDLIVQVVRCFEKEDVIHVMETVDPLKDIEVIQLELLLADLDVLERFCQKLQRWGKIPTKEGKLAQQQWESLQVVQKHLHQGIAVREMALTDTQQKALESLSLLSAKPMILVANVEEETLRHPSPLVLEVQEYAREKGFIVELVCAQFEKELLMLEEEERPSFLQSLGLKETSLRSLTRTCYAQLQLNTYFTAGEKETRAWTFPQGITAPSAAGIIHSDLEKGFIRAEVYHYEDLLEHRSEENLRALGLIRTEGKSYLVKDGDILYFRFNL